MGLVIENVTISKNTVKTGEKIKVAVLIKEKATEPAMYRLPFKLGENQGGIK